MTSKSQTQELNNSWQKFKCASSFQEVSWNHSSVENLKSSRDEDLKMSAV